MQKVTYGKIVIVVRRATIGDELRSQQTDLRLEKLYDKDASGFWPQFSNLSGHVVKSKGLPFDPLTLPDLPDDKLKAAYEQFLTLDKKLMEQWQSAVNLADTPADAVISVEALPDNADPNI